MPKRTTKKLRPIDVTAKETLNWWSKTYVFVNKTKIRTLHGVFIIAFVAGVSATLIWTISNDRHPFSRASETVPENGCVVSPAGGEFGRDTSISIKCGSKVTEAYMQWQDGGERHKITSTSTDPNMSFDFDTMYMLSLGDRTLTVSGKYVSGFLSSSQQRQLAQHEARIKSLEDQIKIEERRVEGFNTIIKQFEVRKNAYPANSVMARRMQAYIDMYQKQIDRSQNIIGSRNQEIDRLKEKNEKINERMRQSYRAFSQDYEFKTKQDFSISNVPRIIYANLDGRVVYESLGEGRGKILFSTEGEISGLGYYDGKFYNAVGRGPDITIETRNHNKELLGSFNVNIGGGKHNTIYDMSFDETGFWGVDNSRIFHYNLNNSLIDKELLIPEGYYNSYGIAYNKDTEETYVLVLDESGLKRNCPAIAIYDKYGNEKNRFFAPVGCTSAIFGLGFDKANNSLWASTWDSATNLINFDLTGRLIKEIPSNIQYGSVEVFNDSWGDKPDLYINDVFLEGGLVKIRYCNEGKGMQFNEANFPDTFYIKMNINGIVFDGYSSNSNYPFSVPEPEDCRESEGYSLSRHFYFKDVPSSLNIEAEIDWQKNIDESDENNNIFTKNIIRNQEYSWLQIPASYKYFSLDYLGANYVQVSEEELLGMQAMLISTCDQVCKDVGKSSGAYCDAWGGLSSYCRKTEVNGVLASASDECVEDPWLTKVGSHYCCCSNATNLSAGELTLSRGDDMGSSNYLIQGSINNRVLPFDARAFRENFTIRSIEIDFESDNPGLIRSADLYMNGVKKGSGLIMQDKIIFSNLDAGGPAVVNANTESYFHLMVNVSDYSDGIKIGDNFNLKLSKVSAVSASGKNITLDQIDNISSGSKYLFKTIITFAKQNLTSSPVGGSLLRFTVSADWKGVAEIKQLGFYIKTIGCEVSDLYLYDVDNSIKLSDVPANIDSSGNVKLAVGQIHDNDVLTIGNAVRTLEVRGRVSGYGSDGDVLVVGFQNDSIYASSGSASQIATNYYNAWSDRSAPSHSVNTNDWTNGFSLPSMNFGQSFVIR